MNFQWMPELGWRYGYIFAWALMLALVTIIYFFFKRKNGIEQRGCKDDVFIYY